MAMPSGNVVIPDKMQFPVPGVSPISVAVGVGGLHRQWMPDERDGFIGWLRSEFAAANAIIDALCHHLRAVGEVGEYDAAIGYIQQRRCNWNSVLHMQQYFPVGEVGYALEQVAWRRQHHHQQHRFFDNGKGNLGKNFRRGNFGTRQGQRAEGMVKEGHGYGAAMDNHRHDENDSLYNSVTDKYREKCEAKLDDKGLTHKGDNKGANLDTETLGDGLLKSSLSSEENISDCSGHQTAEVEGERASDSKGPHVQVNDPRPHQDQGIDQNLTTIAKTFVGTEMFDGKLVNVLEGLKLYEQLYDDSDVAKLVSLANDLRGAGKRGQLQGHTFMISKGPTKGHGREMIQLGVPVVDIHPEDESTSATPKDRKIEGIPALLQNVIERLVGLESMTVKPDSCIIDFYNEGDHSQPHVWPPWFGKPVCILFLTECDMTFGKVIGADRPGDYRGSLKLSLASGSLLSVQGRSADIARHAIPAIRKQRILVTFTKSLPRRTTPSDGQRLPPHGPAPPHWGPSLGRTSNHIRHPVGPKHFAPVPTTGVLPAPPLHPQLPPNVPLFVPPAVAPAMTFPASVPLPPGTTSWPALPIPRHPAPRIPVPGTGVFLPPSGSGASSSPQTVSSSAAPDTIHSEEVDLFAENGTMVSSVSMDEKLDASVQEKGCNGMVEAKVIMTDEHEQVKIKEASKAIGSSLEEKEREEYIF